MAGSQSLEDVQRELEALRLGAGADVSLGVTTTIDIHSLGKKMSAEVAVKDRRWMLRKYEKCFTGKEGVQWLIANKFSADVESAVLLGNRYAIEPQRLSPHALRFRSQSADGGLFLARDGLARVQERGPVLPLQEGPAILC